MISNEEDEVERQALNLVIGHTAGSLDEARMVIERLNEKRRKSDLAVFYGHMGCARDAFKELIVDEKVYACSPILTGFIPAGLLTRLRNTKNLVLAEILNLTPRKGKPKLAALAPDFSYDGHDGVFISPYSAKRVVRAGSKTFDANYRKQTGKNLYRLEFKPVDKDYLQGMFEAWNNDNIGFENSLALWVSRDKIRKL